MTIDFQKLNGLVPAVVQDAATNRVLMVGFMNEAAYQRTIDTKKITFFSRTRNTLWTKGETSGNFLILNEIIEDCDQDTLLIKASPNGPVCHTGADTCFNEVNKPGLEFLSELEALIADRKAKLPEKSYTTDLFNKGINKIAQKVGEEATEVVIDAVAGNKGRVVEESADLMYHLIVLLRYHELSLSDVVKVLIKRHSK
jgi:phosphoribosyl-ATP pyrophosphohydrolase/phosphoribosyl-AMP cyclohydrolase